MTRVASLYVPGTFAVRTATTAGQRVHGGGRRPGPQAALDVAALEEFNAGTARAVAENARRPHRERAREAIQRGMEKREAR